jgi:hypothetical protein
MSQILLKLNAFHDEAYQYATLGSEFMAKPTDYIDSEDYANAMKREIKSNVLGARFRSDAEKRTQAVTVAWQQRQVVVP